MPGLPLSLGCKVCWEILTGLAEWAIEKTAQEGGRLAESGRKTDLEKRWAKDGYGQEKGGKTVKQAPGGEKTETRYQKSRVTD